MKLSKIALWSLLAASTLVAPKASGSTLFGGALFGDSSLRTFFAVDQTTGARTPIGSVSPAGFYDLTSDWRPQSYRIWGVSQDGLFTLSRIDPTTGTRTAVGSMSTNIQSLAFDPTTETLFGAGSAGLYKIDVNTASATLVGGPSGIYPYAALGCDLAGNLFGFSSPTPPEGIARIDKTTGAFQLVGPTNTPDKVWLTDLAVRPEDGVMIGVGDFVFGSNKLYQVNTTTGALIPIGNSQFQQLAGLAFSPVPEPSTILLLAATLPALTVRRRIPDQASRPMGTDPAPTKPRTF
jgi:hypothetical protein